MSRITIDLSEKELPHLSYWRILPYLQCLESKLFRETDVS